MLPSNAERLTRLTGHAPQQARFNWENGLRDRTKEPPGRFGNGSMKVRGAEPKRVTHTDHQRVVPSSGQAGPASGSGGRCSVLVLQQRMKVRFKG